MSDAKSYANHLVHVNILHDVYIGKQGRGKRARGRIPFAYDYVGSTKVSYALPCEV